MNKKVKEFLDNSSNYEVVEYIGNLQQENQELKKQLEETNKMIEKCGFVNIEQVMLNYCGLLSQQKEFIKYLEDGIKSSSTLDTINKQTAMYIYSTALKRYKEIIGE